MIVVETERLLLRQFRDDDATRIVELLNDYEVSKNLSVVKYPYRLEDAVYFINLQRGFDPRSRTCAICFRHSPDKLLGTVSYKFEFEEAVPEFGYWLGQIYWGNRIMTEAASALVGFAFSNPEIQSLNSGYWNPISGRLLRNIGFEETHQSKLFCLAQNKEVPVTKLQLKRSRWRELQNALL